jgi:hypothetical protein
MGSLLTTKLSPPRITLPSTADSSSAPKTVITLQKASSSSSKAPGKSLTQPTIKWERRKRASDAYAPSLRSGCTMTLWAAKGMGILFGGVTDEDTNEETLESVFWNDL